ncbi:MAG: hypothetical protein ACJA09_000990 [Alcanivorax sp.]|jgi:hypothetical protein
MVDNSAAEQALAKRCLAVLGFDILSGFVISAFPLQFVSFIALGIDVLGI